MKTNDVITDNYTLLKKITLFAIVASIVGVSAWLFLKKKPNKQDVIKISVVFPMSGGAASAGESALNGLQLCAEEWNEKGGLLSKKITFEVLDSKADPKEGSMLANRIFLSENEPDLIVSAVSGVTLNVQAISEKQKKILLGIIGSGHFITETTKYSLRNFITPQLVSKNILELTRNKFNKNELSVFYCNTEMGNSFKDDLLREAVRQKFKITKVAAYEERQNSYRDQIHKSNLTNDDIVYINGIDNSMGLFIRQLRESGFRGVIVGDVNIINASCLEVAGDFIYNTYYIDLKQTPELKILRDRFLLKYGKPMDMLAIYCYNGLDLLFTKIQELNALDNDTIMKNINGFRYNAKCGVIEVENYEFIYPYESRAVKLGAQ